MRCTQRNRRWQNRCRRRRTRSRTSSKNLRAFAVKVGGREQLAVEAFADAVEEIPLTLAENAGLDPIDIMVALRAQHEKPNSQTFGIDVTTGKIVDMCKQMVIEPLRVKQQVIKSATEATNMILKIDDLISIKGGEQDAPRCLQEEWAVWVAWVAWAVWAECPTKNPKISFLLLFNNLKK